MDSLLNRLHIFRATEQYDSSNPIRYHMPGHKGGNGIPLSLWDSLIKYDVTEIPGMDYLYQPRGILADAMMACAGIFGSLETLFLVNGSTAGIHGALEALAKDKKEIVLPRDCHKAAYHKIVMDGLLPHYVPVAFDKKTLTPAVVSPDDIAKTMDRTRCKIVLVTSPNYHGMCCDIKRIAEEVHKRDGILIVDEAHGGHFAFSSALPPSAIALGGDIVIQSAHKTMPCINQGAYLHICSNRVDAEKINRALSMIQTSSPSYIIMGLLEYAAVYLHQNGDRLYRGLTKEIQWLGESLTEPEDLRISADLCKNAVAKDTTRILIDAYGGGYTGYDLEVQLREKYRVVCEAADLYHCMLIATISDPPFYLETLHEALKGKRKINREPPAGIPPAMTGPVPIMALLPQEAVRRDSKWVGLAEAVGHIARCAIIPYPPGIPLIMPGEVITEETATVIESIWKEGGFVEGMNDNLTMDVVK